MIKKYNRARYREKFRRYRIFYWILVLIFLASLVGEIFWFGDFGFHYEIEEVSFLPFFSDLF